MTCKYIYGETWRGFLCGGRPGSQPAEASEIGTIEPSCEHEDCDEAGTMLTVGGLRCPQHRTRPAP